MTSTFTTAGTCARFIDIELDGDFIREVRFIGGCSGNSRGLSALVRGMAATEVIERTRGIVCRNGTSCPDQLARALAGLVAKRNLLSDIVA